MVMNERLFNEMKHKREGGKNVVGIWQQREFKF